MIDNPSSVLSELEKLTNIKPIPTKDLPDEMKALVTDASKRELIFGVLTNFFANDPSIAPGTDVYERLAIIFGALANLHPTPTKAQELQVKFREAIARGLKVR